MFVRQSKYDEMALAAATALAAFQKERKAHVEMIEKWNKLVREVNALGGEAALKGNPKSSQFSKEEIARLIQLCHPDKHNGKASATEMTAKLLKLKGDAT